MNSKHMTAVAGSLIAFEASRRIYLRYRHRQLAYMPWGINRGHGVSMRRAMRSADPRFATPPAAKR